MITSHHVIGANHRGAPVVLGGMSFACNGASQPLKVQFGGQVAEVRRLVSGGTPFFRVRPISDWRVGDVFGQLVISVTPVSDAPLLVHQITDVLPSTPADVRKRQEFDVAVYNLAGVRVDTAGIRVSIVIVTK